MVLRVQGNVEFNSTTIETIEPTLIEAITTAGLTTNLRLVLDAGDINSYDGSAQDWVDTSGFANGDQYHRGNTGAPDSFDPTFNGVAGALSENEYFTFDGADQFNYGAANETWMDTLHKDGAIFTIAFWMHMPSGAAGTLCGTMGLIADRGFAFGFGDVVPHAQYSARFATGGAGKAIEVNASTTSTTDAWVMTSISYNENGGNVSFFRENDAVLQVAAANTFDGAYTTPSASNAISALALGVRGATGGAPLASGHRYAGVMMWQGTALTTANLDTIYNATKARFGL